MANFNAPEKKHIYITRREGQFNLLSSEKQAQYTFHFPELSNEQVKELGFSTWYTVDLDKDYGWEYYTAFDLAWELRYLFDSYFFHDSKKEIYKLFDYLGSIEEEQELLRNQYEIDYAKAKIQYWEDRLIEFS